MPWFQSNTCEDQIKRGIFLKYLDRQSLLNAATVNKDWRRLILQTFIAHFNATQSELDANAIAIDDDNHKPWTNSALDAWSYHLAHYLLTEYPHDTTIALLMHQSSYYTASFIACHRASKAFMPLSVDNYHSPARLAQYLTQSKSNIVLTTTLYENHPLCAEATALGKTIIYLDKLSFDLSNVPKADNFKVASLTDLAYVVNTSGSSGHPKQVRIPHYGLYHCMMGHTIPLAVTRNDKIAAYADIAFDAHIVEMMMALGTGATLVIIPAEYRRDITKLAKFYQSKQITIGVFTTSMLRQFDSSMFPSLRVVISTGERFDDTILEKWSNCLIVDGYGPAENTIATWIRLVNRNNQTIMMPGTECFVLKVNSDESVEPSATGEICISGFGLADGYSDEKITAERFKVITHPFKPDEKIRIYRTRDAAILHPDGRIEITGRLDRQIKVYGKLICPEEIEATILHCAPQLSHAFVDAKTDTKTGHPKFIAHLQCKPGTEIIDLRELYNKLSAELPQTFIPTEWVYVNNLAQQPSQKTTLTTPVSVLTTQRIQGYSKLAPRNDDEIRIAKLFMDLLDLDPEKIELYRDDNFFELGGKSLQATVLINTLRQEYRVSISYEQLSYYATIEQLARLIRAQTQQISITPLRNEMPQEGNAPVFFIHSLMGDAEKDYEKLMRQWRVNHPVFAISATGLSQPDLMQSNLLTIAYEYYMSIKKRYPTGNKIIAGWSLGGILALLVQHFFHQENQRDVSAWLIDSECPLLFQSMSNQDYAAYLFDLFEKKLFGQFSIEHMPISQNNLGELSKQTQIYQLFSSIAQQLAEPGLAYKMGLLKTVQCLLLGTLSYQLNATVTHVNLLAATHTQKLRNSQRLGWPLHIRFDKILNIEANHDSLMLETNNANKVSETIQAFCTAQQTYAKVQSIAQRLHQMSMPYVNLSELQYYIQPNGRLNPRDNHSQDIDLATFVAKQFLVSKKRALLIQGDAGSGKSLFCQHLALQLKDNLTNTLVLYIPLSLYEEPLYDIISKHLKRLGFSDTDILHLKQNQSCIFIFDDLDEARIKQNMYATNRLYEWQCRVIYACRTNYKLDIANFKQIFYPTGEKVVYKADLEEITITPFNNAQIDSYVEKFLQSPPETFEMPPDWHDTNRVKQVLYDFPNLREIIRNPFLLRIAMLVLPSFIDDYEQLPFEQRPQMTDSRILDAFMASYWERALNKLTVQGKLPEDGHDPLDDFEAFCIELATLMSNENVTHIRYQLNQQPWAKFFGSNQQDMVKAREACPITVQGDAKSGFIISLIHESLIPYFVNRAQYNQAIPHFQY